jgi:hypothetical protein
MWLLGILALMVVVAGVFYRLAVRSRDKQRADPGLRRAGVDAPPSSADAVDRAAGTESWKSPGDGDSP